MPAGRPSPYRPEYAEQARKLCRNGATDREIADILDVCVRTFYRWRLEHDAFAEALTEGKDLADDRVERSLYDRACGYDYQAEKVFHPSGATEPVIVAVRTHVPADVGAARHWLACRRRQPWSGVVEPEPTPSIVETLRSAEVRLEKIRRRQAEENEIRISEAIRAGVAEELARRGLAPEIQEPPVSDRAAGPAPPGSA